jgi:hypothetical protein
METLSVLAVISFTVFSTCSSLSALQGPEIIRGVLNPKFQAV